LPSTFIAGTELKFRHPKLSGTSYVTDYGKLYTQHTGREGKSTEKYAQAKVSFQKL